MARSIPNHLSNIAAGHQRKKLEPVLAYFGVGASETRSDGFSFVHVVSAKYSPGLTAGVLTIFFVMERTGPWPANIDELVSIKPPSAVRGGQRGIPGASFFQFSSFGNVANQLAEFREYAAKRGRRGDGTARTEHATKKPARKIVWDKTQSAQPA